jgi:hypothetical protein
MFCCICKALVLTTLNRVILEKLIVTQLIKKFPFFYGNRRFLRHLQEPVPSLCLEPDESGHNEGITEGLETHCQAVPRKRWLLVFRMAYNQLHSCGLIKELLGLFLHDNCIYPLFHAVPIDIIPINVMQQVK